MTSNTVWKLLLSCALVAILLPLSVNAQSAATTSALSSPVYDISKEIKLEGTIDNIETNTSAGPVGTHLLIASAQGEVDVHLGASATVTAKNLGLTVGENVHVTGMMATVNGNSVLLARILATANHIYVLRNEHGVPIRSLIPRGGAGSAAAATPQKGGL